MKFKRSVSNIWKADCEENEEDEEDMIAYVEEDFVTDDDKSLKGENESHSNSEQDSILPNSSTTKFSTILDKQPSSEVELGTSIIDPKLNKSKNVTVLGAYGSTTVAADASGSGESDESSSSLVGLHTRHEKRNLANMVSWTLYYIYYIYSKTILF